MAWFKLFILFFLASAYAWGQSSCGIYGNREDFINDRITYFFEDCDFNVLHNKDIVGDHLSNRLRFKFDFIFGYTDGKDVYRAYGAKSLLSTYGFYKVIYEDDVIIYARTSRDYRANEHTYLYYSLTKDSPIVPLRDRFFDFRSNAKGSVKLHVTSLKKRLNLSSISEDPSRAVVEVVARVDAPKRIEKKKPDISARLQTTTRRPKIFNVRSWWRKQERSSLF